MSPARPVARWPAGCAGLHWIPFALAALLAGCAPPDIATRDGSPRDDLPPHITELTGLGSAVRPAWSPDGRRFLYLDALVGDVYEYDLAASSSRPLTAHFDHLGFTRAHYLASGDFLLCGPTSVDPDDPDKGRWDTEFFVLGQALDGPAQPLDEDCFEGPAVARQSMRIAWTRTSVPEEILTAHSELWTGEVELSGERPRIAGARRLLERSDLYYLAMFEPQDFRPPAERELIFSAYGYRGGEVMGMDLDTGEISNYSRNWWYDEPEGIAPGGAYALVEREFTLLMNPSGEIDIWALRLDGSGDYTRLTRFSDYRGFGANNPVVSPDCRTFLFALRVKGGQHGNSDGLFLYDLAASPHTPADFCQAR